MNENESLTVTLTLDNDEELECAVLTIFESDAREYIALLPLNDDGENEDGQIYLYRLIDNGEDEEPGPREHIRRSGIRTCFRCIQRMDG